jgi:hypothetical protein
MIETIIDSISAPFGCYPGTVEVSVHQVNENGDRTAFETVRLSLPSDTIKPNGEHNLCAVEAFVFKCFNGSRMNSTL